MPQCPIAGDATKHTFNSLFVLQLFPLWIGLRVGSGRVGSGNLDPRVTLAPGFAVPFARTEITIVHSIVSVPTTDLHKYSSQMPYLLFTPYHIM